MKTMLSLVSFLVLAFTAGAQEYFRDINVTSVNTEYPRTSFMSYEDMSSASSYRFESSPRFLSLNGEWDFVYTDDYRTLPSDLDSIDAWGVIKVPGNWERQGFGTAIYTNHQYEFDTYLPNPPQLPEAVPAGVYRRTFDIPSGWDGNEVFLHIAGAKSGVYVYVNGVEVGYNEDSKNPAEFRITDYIETGENTLVIKILRWSTGSFLECQDFWRISGIERDVYLFAQPKVSLRDFRLKSSLSEDLKDGDFALETDITSRSEKDRYTKVSYVLDYNGKTVSSSETGFTLAAGTDTTLRFEDVVKDVKSWNADTPELYTLYIRVSGDDGDNEVVPFRFGFRRLEIKDGLFLLNGQPLKFKGVNMHEHDQVTGHYVTEDVLRNDLLKMKRNNINAVRLAHYPQQRRFYELADEYGIYVYDEANIESHGMYYDLRKGGTLGNNPEWLEHHMYRTINMYERNKNYTCVTFWSLGNEAGNGYNFYQTYLWLKHADAEWAQRPVNYERAQWEWNTDMFVPQYPDAAWFERVGASGADRPVIPSEYSHAMGNSNGNLSGIWDAIYKYPQLQGGFIWDWIDQGFLEVDSLGRRYWTYGGDYGGEYVPSDGNFCCNGIIGPDRKPHPAMEEVKYIFQDIAFIDAGNGQTGIINRSYFTRIDSRYTILATLLRNGYAEKAKSFTFNIAPQDTVVFTPFGPEDMKKEGEYFANYKVLMAFDTPALLRGHEVAKGQVFLGGDFTHEEPSLKGKKLQISDEGRILRVSSDDVSLVFDADKMAVTSYKVGGKEFVKDGFGFRPNFWRGPNDNDYGNGMPSRLQVWKDPLLSAEITGSRHEGKAVVFDVRYELATSGECVMSYKLWPSGVLDVAMVLEPGEGAPELPRVGVRFRLPSSMNRALWYGRGPHENYIDRNASAFVRWHSLYTPELYHPYVRPQENGHRTDTRMLEISSQLTIVSDEYFGFNMLDNCVEHFDSEEYKDRPYQWTNLKPQDRIHDTEAAKNRLRRQVHINDIPETDYVEVCIDLVQMGVGGYDSWGALPDAKHRIDPSVRREFNFRVVPHKLFL